MALKKILCIGFELASDDVQYFNFESDISLLDWDIILFKPIISSYISSYVDYYMGKPCLSDSFSFHLKEQCDHWRREIKYALDSGKTVIVFLPELQEVYVDTGERQYSGTGRNQKATRIVSPHTNYSVIPVPLNPVSTKGAAIKLATHDADVLAPYWNEFKEVSQYKIIFTADKIPACLLTKNGDKPVGAIYRSKNSSGSLILLPDIDFYPENFLEEKGKEEHWTPVATQFASRMVRIVVELDKVLHSTDEITPEPPWASNSDYVLPQETQLNQELLLAEEVIEKAWKAKEAILENLNNSRRLKNLLYEKGKPLENAIIDGLIIMGFHAEPFKDSNSEFDVVFESDEGRLIGEAEGKDNKAINIDKLRQLAMNIHEDLQREEVTKPAKGVLFGNGFRLSPLSDRKIQFTEKCISAAQSSSTALLPTSELFRVVRALLQHPNNDFARLCRKAIFEGAGIISLPSSPTSNMQTVLELMDSQER
ncbi:MAG: hypothetical protein WAU15_04925 [Nitrosomonas sp.]